MPIPQRRAGPLTGVVLLMASLFGTPVVAQSLVPGPPGPYVVDLRILTLGLPTAEALYPPVTVETVVPARAPGMELSGHVYLLQAGAARLGVGAVVSVARTTTSTARATMWLVTPQVSANFGTGDGWSYLGGGLGTGHVRTHVTNPLVSDNASDRTSNLLVLNGGGGARWFIMRRMAIGFDVRVYRLAAGRARGSDSRTPASAVTAASVGLSVR